MELEDLKPHENFKMDINGEEFTLFFDQDLSGEFAVWGSNNYRIYATPGWEGHSVSAQVQPLDEVGDPKTDIFEDADSYDKPIHNFEEYCIVVKALSQKIILIYEMEKGASYNIQDGLNSAGDLLDIFDNKGIDFLTLDLNDMENVQLVRREMTGHIVGSEKYLESDQEMQSELLMLQACLLKDENVIEERYKDSSFQLKDISRYLQIRKHAEMTINDISYSLSLGDEETSDDVAIWTNPYLYKIYSTPWVEGSSLKVDVMTKDNQYVNSEKHIKPIKSFEEYYILTKALATKIILLYEMEQKWLKTQGSS